MAWIELHQAVWTHRKTFELASRLDLDETYAAAHVIRLWTWALDNAPDGSLAGLSDRAIAYGAGWRGDETAFVAALVGSGWLEDSRQIHDWEEYAGRLVERREANAERARLARAARRGHQHNSHANDVQPTSGVHADDVGGLPDRTGPDTTGPDRTPTPQPPPATEREGERPKRRRGANGTAQHDETGVTPVTPGDRELWNLALDRIRPDLSVGNFEQVGRIAPIGRAPDGSLHLRAPPGEGFQRFRGHIARALLDAGDQAGPRVTIVEG